MSEPIRIESIAEMRQMARHHQETADNLRAAPRSHQQIQSFLGSLGPIFGEFRSTTLHVLDQRQRSYEQQATDHEAFAAGLDAAVGQWETHQAEATQQVRGVSDC